MAAIFFIRFDGTICSRRSPPAVLLAGGAARIYNNHRTHPRRSGNKAFTQFFLEKIAGAGQRPAAPRVGAGAGQRPAAPRVGALGASQRFPGQAVRRELRLHSRYFPQPA